MKQIYWNKGLYKGLSKTVRATFENLSPGILHGVGDFWNIEVVEI